MFPLFFAQCTGFQSPREQIISFPPCVSLSLMAQAQRTCLNCWPSTSLIDSFVLHQILDHLEFLPSKQRHTDKDLFPYQAATVWNNLPHSIRHSTFMSSFKSSLTHSVRHSTFISSFKSSLTHSVRHSTFISSFKSSLTHSVRHSTLISSFKSSPTHIIRHSTLISSFKSPKNTVQLNDDKTELKLATLKLLHSHYSLPQYV